MTLEGIVRLVSPPQLRNADSPILVTPSGITKLPVKSAPSKALTPIVCKLDPLEKVSVPVAVQLPSKELLPIAVTEAGITRLPVTPVSPSNALLPMVSKPSFRTREVKPDVPSKALYSIEVTLLGITNGPVKEVKTVVKLADPITVIP